MSSYRNPLHITKEEVDKKFDKIWDETLGDETFQRLRDSINRDELTYERLLKEAEDETINLLYETGLTCLKAKLFSILLIIQAGNFISKSSDFATAYYCLLKYGQTPKDLLNIREAPYKLQSDGILQLVEFGNMTMRIYENGKAVLWNADSYGTALKTKIIMNMILYLNEMKNELKYTLFDRFPEISLTDDLAVVAEAFGCSLDITLDNLKEFADNIKMFERCETRIDTRKNLLRQHHAARAPRSIPMDFGSVMGRAPAPGELKEVKTTGPEENDPKKLLRGEAYQRYRRRKRGGGGGGAAGGRRSKRRRHGKRRNTRRH